MGLMMGMELTIPGAPIVAKCLERGLNINCTHDTVIRMLPAMNITKAEVDKGMKILGWRAGRGDMMARPDGRRAGELRPVRITLGFLKSAPSSVLIETGNTRVICTAIVAARRAAVSPEHRARVGDGGVRDAAGVDLDPQAAGPLGQGGRAHGGDTAAHRQVASGRYGHGETGRADHLDRLRRPRRGRRDAHGVALRARTWRWPTAWSGCGRRGSSRDGCSRRRSRR